MTPLLPAEFDGGEVVGSGNPGMPCWRMHADTSSIRACACVDGGSELGGPFGSRLWHECAADWNAGDCTVLGEPIRTVWPLTFGSGKFGTPCERMHLENATPDSTALAVNAEVLAPPVGLGELPPHPATSTPLKSAATASSQARGRVSLFGWMLYAIRFSFMGCFPGVRVLVPDRFYAVGCFGGVSLSEAGEAVLLGGAGETALKHCGATLVTTRSYGCGCL